MPDADGRFKGISVPALPWVKETPRPKSARLARWSNLDEVNAKTRAALNNSEILTFGDVHTCSALCPCHSGGEPPADFIGVG